MGESSSPENITPSIAIPIVHSEFQITPEQQDSLRHLKSFFQTDSQIKEEFRAITPLSSKDQRDINITNPQDYSNRLVSSTETIAKLFGTLSSDMNYLGLNGNSVLEKSELIAQNLEDSAVRNSDDLGSLAKWHEFYISNIRPDFKKQISKNIIGYNFRKDAYFLSLAQEATSFNELLHLAHASLTSDENLFEKLPKWESFTEPLGETKVEYNAYGEPNETAKEVFDKLKQNAESFISHQVNHPDQQEIPTILHLFSLDQTIQLMIRDFGHATTIEIDISDPNSILVRYQIPKVFDGVKVNRLPGINKINSESPNTGASGRFTCPPQELGQTIVNFIQKIPTDSNWQS